MRKALSGIALAVLSLMFIILTTGSSHAAVDDGNVDGLKISKVGYNARGNDTSFNRNYEYVEITRDDNAVAGLVIDSLWVKDQWAVNHSDSTCNRYEVKNVTLAGDVKTIRVYMGSGVDRTVSNVVYRFADSKCGYHGHIFNNLGDTVYITMGDDSEKVSYDFENGYYVN